MQHTATLIISTFFLVPSLCFITISPATQTISEGHELKISCKINESASMCVWQHNGQIIENSSTDTEYDEDDYTVTTDLKAGHCVVKKANALIRDGGRWVCTVIPLKNISYTAQAIAEIVVTAKVWKGSVRASILCAVIIMSAVILVLLWLCLSSEVINWRRRECMIVSKECEESPVAIVTIA